LPADISSAPWRHHAEAPSKGSEKPPMGGNSLSKKSFSAGK